VPGTVSNKTEAACRLRTAPTTTTGSPMIRRILASLAIAAGTFHSNVAAQEVRVPESFLTIQSAIDSSPAGATVLVGPGVYRETLVIEKALTLRSTHGASATVIDGGSRNTVVWVRGTGDEKVTIAGFRITNGSNTFDNPYSATTGTGGGVRVESVRATIADNIIAGNRSCFGAGIASQTATVAILRNRIHDNVQDPGCGGANGGGIWMNGGGSAASRIAENTITGHRVAGYGGGIAVTAVDGITIVGNHIARNAAYDYGGGLMLEGGVATVSKNIIADNQVETEQSMGGGMAIFVVDANQRVKVSENILRANKATTGSAAMLLTYYERALTFTLNAVAGSTSGPLISCSGTPAGLKYNILTNAAGPTLAAGCPGVTD
jgi:hypothetical protein